MENIADLTTVRSQPGPLKKEYTEFINLATHDLDAPLRKLSTLVGMLTKKIKPELQDADALGYVDRIESCVTDMRTMLDGMSMLSHVISNTEPFVTCDLAVITQDVLQGLQPVTNQKNATIEVGALPTVTGMPGQLRQLIANIIENGLKFTTDNVPPKLMVKCAELKEQEKQRWELGVGTYHQLEFIDNGIGFKQENREKIFKPFVRLHGKSQYAGHGMGLAIAKKIAENHDGILFAESNENEGSRFVLILPQTPSETC